MTVSYSLEACLWHNNQCLLFPLIHIFAFVLDFAFFKINANLKNLTARRINVTGNQVKLIT